MLLDMWDGMAAAESCSGEDGKADDE